MLSIQLIAVRTVQVKDADLDRSHTAGQAEPNPLLFIPAPSQHAPWLCGPQD